MGWGPGHTPKSNNTKKATAADIVMTPRWLTAMIIDHFKPSGLILEPCKGTGNFYNLLPNPKDWCEINKQFLPEGVEPRDFFDWNKKVDWILTNPPFSIYNDFLAHTFEVADNVVFLVPVGKAFKSMTLERMTKKYGGLKEVFIIGGGGVANFGYGFLIGCLYWQRNYTGPITKFFDEAHVQAWRAKCEHEFEGSNGKCLDCGVRRNPKPENLVGQTTPGTSSSA